MNSLSSSLPLLCPSPRHSWWRRHWHWGGRGGSQIQLRAIRAAASVSPPSLAETHLVPSSICPSSWCTYHRRRDSVSIIIPLCLSPLSFRAAEMRKRERRQTWFSVRIIPLPHNLKKFGRPDFPLFQMQRSGGKEKKFGVILMHGRGKGLRRGDHDFPPLFLYGCACAYT